MGVWGAVMDGLLRGAPSLCFFARFLHRIPPALPLSPSLAPPSRLPRRYFCTPPPADLALIRALQSQIAHQDKVGRLQDARSPPKPFKLVDKPGVQELFLQRSFGDEDIEISCVFHDQSYPPADEEEGYEPPVHNVPTKMVQMTIKISRSADKPFMEAVCVTFGEETHIERVLLKDPAAHYKQVPYEGPDFSKLDGKVKSGFLKYLGARGIDGHLGKFLLDFMCQKEQREYSGWLQKLELFVKK